jgi:hypothetical protein
MAKRFLTPLNLPNLASNPETGAEGDLYFNTIENVIKIYIDNEWVDLQGGASVIYAEDQPDVTDLEPGTIWVDSDAVVIGGGVGSNINAELPILYDSETKTVSGDGNILVSVNHGSNENFERPSYAEVVYWKGSVNPLNAINGDFWYDTSGDL